MESWLQRVPPAVEMAAVLPSEGVVIREGNREAEQWVWAPRCWGGVLRSPLGFLLTSELLSDQQTDTSLATDLSWT